MKSVVIGLGVVIVVLLAILLFWPSHRQPGPSNEPQTAAVQIVSSDGRVSVSQPAADALIVSPVTVQGTVTGGGWFFEGSFPVHVLDSNGMVIGRGVAQAQGDWTSTSSVPFTALVTYTMPKGADGRIVLLKDNPSGDAGNDLSLSIPVRYK
jgi:hypothetical protein